MVLLFLLFDLSRFALLPGKIELCFMFLIAVFELPWYKSGRIKGISQ